MVSRTGNGLQLFGGGCIGWAWTGRRSGSEARPSFLPWSQVFGATATATAHPPFFGQVGRIRSQRLGRAHMHRLSHTHPAPCRTLVHPHAHTHTTHSSPMQLSTCTRFPSRFPCSAPLLLVRQRPDDQVPTAGDRNR
ncbi:hypothetical protein N656DRAFT_773814 [Canariomyces notabilis]|uniref:Uncharacterized protein n=1 Tax=Canariomyces notabilis TaxID=2074819 RepID=A0AAN6TNV4_9PEZI|nr:hypothetical protein N656DRAFT_773814 [Canariomyces arenarius]